MASPRAFPRTDAYALDYGAAAAKYVDAFFQNIQWDEVNRRFERAQKLHAALKA